jgi:hypothetical protein
MLVVVSLTAATCATRSEKLFGFLLVSLPMTFFTLSWILPGVLAAAAALSWSQRFSQATLAWIIGPGYVVLIGILLNLTFCILCLMLAAWWLAREVHQGPSRISEYLRLLDKKLRSPWGDRAEKWLLNHYPLAWLNVHDHAWIAVPLAIGATAAGVVYWLESDPPVDRQSVGLILFLAGYLAVMMLLMVWGVIVQSLKGERETRFNEVLYTLPIQPSRFVISRLLEAAFYAGPPLLVIGLAAALI